MFIWRKGRSVRQMREDGLDRIESLSFAAGGCHHLIQQVSEKDLIGMYTANAAPGPPEAFSFNRYTLQIRIWPRPDKQYRMGLVGRKVVVL